MQKLKKNTKKKTKMKKTRTFVCSTMSKFKLQ